MLFSSSAQGWEILKKHVELSIKSQSDTRWESRIKCIKPLRYNLKEVLLALKDLEAISIERKDGRAASETKSLIAHLSKWSFLLSVFIWYDMTSMTDSRLSSLAMLSIENDCARSLDYDNVITAFANKKVRSRLFK